MYLTNAFCVTDALVSICFTNDTHRNSYMVNEYYVHLIYFFLLRLNTDYIGVLLHSHSANTMVYFIVFMLVR